MRVTPAMSQPAELICNAAAPSRIVRGIDASVLCDEAKALKLTYRLMANMEQLSIPAPTAPRRADGLWQHTCFEAFIGTKESPAYYEFNFAPSGEWAAYGFSGYRDGGPLAGEMVAPDILVRKSAGHLELAATVRLGHLPLVRSAMFLRLGLSVVIEETDGTRSYWALNHPAEKPDFHHPDSFALELALADQSA
jgi:hypothetical protein